MELLHGHEKTVIFFVFNIIILILLLIDLGIFKKHKEHIVPFREAAIRTAVMVLISFSFAGLIYVLYASGHTPELKTTKTLEFITGYLLEYSLSIDNLFVFIMIFQKFKIAPSFQPEILKWGIIGALILRGIMIFFGAALVHKFEWFLYIFGALLLYTAWKMFRHNDEEEYNPDASPLVKLAKKFIPFTEHHHKDHFFVKEDHKKFVATPLFLALIVVEVSDVMFALDSIPAIFSITTDSIIIYTSNVFAIVGLRSLYFMINGVMDLFIHLQRGVSLILGFIGIKMLLPFVSELLNMQKIHIPVAISLAVIASILATSIIFSLPEYHKKKNSKSGA